MKCPKCNSNKIRYAHSFIYEHVYKCKDCYHRIIVKRNQKEIS